MRGVRKLASVRILLECYYYYWQNIIYICFPTPLPFHYPLPLRLENYRITYRVRQLISYLHIRLGYYFPRIPYTRKYSYRQWFESRFNQVSGSGSGFGIRNRIQEGKNYKQKQKKLRIFMFWSDGCSLLRVEGFFCSLDVLYGGLGISKKQFLKKKINKYFSAVYFFFFSHQNPGSGSGGIPAQTVGFDPESINPDAKHWL